MIYGLIIRIYYILVGIASVFNRKAYLWASGRRNLLKNFKNSIDSKSKIVWFHCASLGEFEQGRPVIEEFKLQFPTFKILLTFFSPSGYEVRKNYKGADYIFYLPIDTKRNAFNLIDIVNPRMIFFIKYEFWKNFIKEIERKKIPLFLLSGIFRSNQIFFKKYGKWYRNILNGFTHFFVQDEQSVILLKNIGFENCSVSNDTRYDRVIKIASSLEMRDEIELFKQNKTVLIAGSTWEPDENLIIRFINENEYDIKYIIVPHEIFSSHINQITKKLKKEYIRYSEQNEDKLNQSKVLIIDNIGILSTLYKYGDIAYIGGGFGIGIHNILEAAVFGIPVVFGPHYNKFNEAVQLIKAGGAFPVFNYPQFSSLLKKFIENPVERNKPGEISRIFVKSNQGGTRQIIEFIKSKKYIE